MRYRRLGHSGRLGQAEADAIVGTALDAGITFIDTANVYAEGRSEEIVGQALRNLNVARDDVVIATKVHGPMGDGPNARGASRGHIMTQVEASLRRLGIDHIDLYQIHGFDPATPILETLEALDTLVHRGDVRYLGLAEARRLAPIVSLQAYYSLAGRDLEREIVPMLRAEKIGLMVWSPLAGGFLSGKFRRDGGVAEGRCASFDFPPVDKDRAYGIIDVLDVVARRRDCTVAQAALAWLLHQKAVTSVLVGAKRIDQLQDNIGATEVILEQDDLDALDAASALTSEYPGWMIATQGGSRQAMIDAE
ncbi:aldo/keto reductase [Litoreibacter roseus]|uniref:Aldo/keto reductase n=1 Tax=Litoreibacter roseus TaxID=2601869 RepID=A0A6N6JKQ8_9RHOB|nr:aldo/keto reductase [Litoreibacter roseus]GFE66517.1 aldo/keto reductase [Litoreibacter roseus]